MKRNELNSIIYYFFVCEFESNIIYNNIKKLNNLRFLKLFLTFSK